MWKSGGLRVALAGVVAVVLAGMVGVGPAWANVACINGSPDMVANGTITNAKDLGPYFPGCSVIAFDSAFTMFGPGTCTSTAYSVNLAGAASGNILVILTWNAGPNGTPLNQPDTNVQSGYVNATTSTCTEAVVANSGPLAVTVNSLSATESSGGRASLALAALSLVAAAVMISRRRLGKHAPDA